MQAKHEHKLTANLFVLKINISRAVTVGILRRF